MDASDWNAVVVVLKALHFLSRPGSRSKIQLDQVEEVMRLMNFGQDLHEDTRRELCQVLQQTSSSGLAIPGDMQTSWAA